MKSLEKRMSDFKDFKKAQKNLKEFEKMMELVKNYPIKKSGPAPPSPPYTITDQCKYSFPRNI
ncbi:MAG: hypothetical protein KKB62_02160 [Nanoarchaeota archaeon]|nr:hypothetical protein [Nanoarchaeota archaeon]